MKNERHDSAGLIDKAKSYVSASNAHDLEKIATLLAVDCKYVSSGVGNYEGRDSILNMMRGFFEKFPDVQWQASNFQAQEQREVSFDFLISLAGDCSEGKELLVYDEPGFLCRIEVLR